MRRGVIDGHHNIHGRNLRREQIDIAKLIDIPINQNWRLGLSCLLLQYLLLERIVIPVLKAYPANVGDGKQRSQH